MAKCMKCGGMKYTTGGAKKMAKGGSMKRMAAGGSNQSMGIYGIPQEVTGTSGQYGLMKKGGAMSKINRAVKPGCRGGMVKDANGNCVDERKAKKGGTMKDLSGDGKITKKDVLIGRGVIPKKAAGGPILDKLKAKLAERKVTKTIKQGIKAQVKQKKKLG